MTNAEKISNMNEIELHDFLKEVAASSGNNMTNEFCQKCSYASECEEHGDGCLYDGTGADSIWLWMQMETI